MDELAGAALESLDDNRERGEGVCTAHKSSEPMEVGGTMDDDMTDCEEEEDAVDASPKGEPPCPKTLEPSLI